MSKTITTSESTHHETSALGTIAGILTLSDTVARSVDSATGGGSKTDYHLTVDDRTTTYSSREARDEAARKSI